MTLSSSSHNQNPFSPEANTTAAIFDMDYTLLSGSSGRMFIDYLRHTGEVYRYFRRIDILKMLAASILYKLGLLDPTGLLEMAGKAAAGHPASKMWDISRVWFKEMVIRAVNAAGLERIEWHRQQGHHLVLCSGSSQFVVHLLADHLEIDHWICTEWIVEDGQLTGRLRQPLTYGAGKVHWMEKWAAQHNVALEQSYFYTDHISDYPLLERVAHPFAVNPDRRLAKLARKRQWQILSW